MPASAAGETRRVAVVGVSTRALAASAVRAGYAVSAIDAFGDRDLPPGVDVRAVPRELGRRFSPTAAVRLAETVPCEAVAYGSGLEHGPRLVARLGRGRALWGNAPDVLARARDPRTLGRVLAGHGFVVPDVCVDGVPPAGRGRRWLVKPLASGGGHGIRAWDHGPLPRRAYLQSFVEGTPGSVILVADGRRAQVLGVTRQLVGDVRFGASGYRYCGSLWSAAPLLASPALAARADAVAQAVVAALGLVGVNGIDFIADGDHPVPIEINPRWCASMELVERACGIALFEAHASACRTRVLPPLRLHPDRPGEVYGKAILYARQAVTIGDTDPWLAAADVADVPHRGERMTAGQPVCTVLATGSSAEACLDRLARRAEAVYADLARWRRRAA